MGSYACIKEGNPTPPDYTGYKQTNIATVWYGSFSVRIGYVGNWAFAAGVDRAAGRAGLHPCLCIKKAR